MDKLLTMSKKEVTRVEVMQWIEAKRLKQKKAAEMLQVSERHIRRMLRAYRQSGAEGMVSKRRGKPSNNRLKTEVRQQVIDLIYSQYPDFGPTFAHEKLTERAWNWRCDQRDSPETDGHRRNMEAKESQEISCTPNAGPSRQNIKQPPGKGRLCISGVNIIF